MKADDNSRVTLREWKVVSAAWSGGLLSPWKTFVLWVTLTVLAAFSKKLVAPAFDNLVVPYLAKLKAAGPKPPRSRAFRFMRKSLLVILTTAVVAWLMIHFWPWSGLVGAALGGGALWMAQVAGEVIRRDYGPHLSNWKIARSWLRLMIICATEGMEAGNIAGKALEDEWRGESGYLEFPRQTGRALGDQIGTWPKVTHAGSGYLIEAAHSSPGRVGRPGVLAGITAVILGIWAFGNVNTLWPGDSHTEGLHLFGVVMGGVGVGWVSKAGWEWVCQVRLKIKVQHGGATWNGPNRRKGRVLPGEDYEPIARPHHLGPGEIRFQGDQIRRGEIKQNQAAVPAYQMASEVVFRTGARKHIEWTVAEIIPDVGERMATALAAALDLAIEANRKNIAQAQAAQRARGSDGGNLDKE